LRSAESAQHQVSAVAQILVLLDDIEARGQVFMLATTNRPEHVDAALRRPGRLDQVVWMCLPDEAERADIFEQYLRGLKLAQSLVPDRLRSPPPGGVCASRVGCSEHATITRPLSHCRLFHRRFRFQEETGVWHARPMESASHTSASLSADAVSRYVSLRKTQVHINSQLMSRLARPTLVGAAKRLGIWHKGDLIVSSRGVTDLLTDVCLYDCFPGGKSPISRYQAVAALVTGTQEALVIEAMARLPPFSLYRIQHRKPGIGVEMHDLLTFEDVFVMDRGLGETAEIGLCLAARLIRFPDCGINMTSGASMAVEAILAEGLADDIHAELGRGAQARLARMAAQERSRYSIRLLRDILAELSFGDLASEVGAKDVE
jgi:hypothetical protein